MRLMRRIVVVVAVGLVLSAGLGADVASASDRFVELRVCGGTEFSRSL
jgi:hypothetical protein